MAAAIEAGEAPPEDVAPEVWPACEAFWTGFWTLHRSRSHVVGMAGLSPQPLAYGEMVMWARVAQEEVEMAVTLLQTMDAEWMRHYWETHKG